MLNMCRLNVETKLTLLTTHTHAEKRGHGEVKDNVLLKLITTILVTAKVIKPLGVKVSIKVVKVIKYTKTEPIPTH